MECSKELDYLKSLTAAECREIIYDDMPEKFEFETVSNKQVDSSRWHSHNELILLEKVSNKYFRIFYEEGLTENQDTRPFEYSSPEWNEVEPTEVTVIEYKLKGN